MRAQCRWVEILADNLLAFSVPLHPGSLASFPITCKAEHPRGLSLSPLCDPDLPFRTPLLLGLLDWDGRA